MLLPTLLFQSHHHPYHLDRMRVLTACPKPALQAAVPNHIIPKMTELRTYIFLGKGAFFDSDGKDDHSKDNHNINHQHKGNLIYFKGFLRLFFFFWGGDLYCCYYLETLIGLIFSHMMGFC